MPKLHLWLIAVLGWFVPRRLRGEWRREWEAELQARELVLAPWTRSNRAHRLDLLRRSSSAFWDALLLQPQRLEDEVFQDLRYCLRMMVKSPSFTLIAVGTLALGIGANTAIFTLLDRALIRELAVTNPHELVAVMEEDGAGPAVLSYPMYLDLRDRRELFASVVAFFQRPFSLTDGAHSERVTGQIVSGNYFDGLGVRPAAGRFFLPEEDVSPGTHPVVVVSYGLWTRRFGADPAALGKELGVNGHRYTVVGVAPREFTGTTRGTAPDVYVPVMMQARAQVANDGVLSNRNYGWLRVIARLQPGITRVQAQAGLSTGAGDPTKDESGKTALGKQGLLLTDGRRGHTDRVSDLSLPLTLLMGVVGLVLLIACANVANLLLARAAVRRTEIAVRLAVGASRWRIVRQLVTESVILTALGGVSGLLIANWLIRVLLGIQQQVNFVPRMMDGALDGRTLIFTTVVSLLTSLVFSRSGGSCLPV